MPAHPRAHRHRPRGVVAALAAVASATALLLGAPAAADAACVPTGPPVRVDVAGPELADVGATEVVLTAYDGCGARVDLVGELALRLSWVGGATAPAGTVVLGPGDAGRVTAGVVLPRTGLTTIEVLHGGSAVGRTGVLVGSPDGEPVLDVASVAVVGGEYRVTGAVVDPDQPAAPRTVSVVVDVTEVLQVDASGHFAPWDGAPASVGAAHGFEVRTRVPAGRHRVCLTTDDLVRESGERRRHALRCDLVDGGPVLTAPVGSYDGLHRIPGGLVAVGWAIDPSQAGSVARVEVVGHGTFPGGAPIGEHREPAQSTTLERADVGRAYPAYGSGHGVRSTAWAADSGTTFEICLHLRTGSLGCRTAVYDSSPLGALDAVTASSGAVRVRGWALDQDTYDPTRVRVLVDGRPVAVAAARSPRPDVGALFGPAAGGLVPGYGGDRGFDLTVAAPAGRRDVCVQAVDVEGPLPELQDELLGCRAVLVPDGRPVGSLDGVVAVPGGVALRGWAADRDTPTAPVQVHVYRDGRGAAVVRADGRRPDLLAVDGGRLGAHHGFTAAVVTGERARLCTYAVDTAGGENATLGCRDVTRPVLPRGALDAATRTSGQRVSLRGWALDPDVVAPVTVHAYVDGSFAGAATADLPRADVARAEPGWGPLHGYLVDVAARPGAQVCLYALNRGAGSASTTLGCRTA